MPSSTITIGFWAYSVNLQTRRMVQHPSMLRRNLDNDYCILHVTRRDSFQSICLDIKKKKKVFTQGKKRKIYILTPPPKKKEQTTYFFHPNSHPVFPNSLDYRGLEREVQFS